LTFISKLYRALRGFSVTAELLANAARYSSYYWHIYNSFNKRHDLISELLFVFMISSVCIFEM